MPDKNPDIQEKLQQLHQQYAQKLPDRVSTLEKRWLALNLDDPHSAQFDNLVREFHSLAGSGASYGFPQITSLSREIENILLKAKSDNGQDSDVVKSKINTKLAALKQAATTENLS